MKNIFENAYFGKPYKTRGGHKALFIHHYKDSESDDMYQLIVEGSVVTYVYTKNGEIAPSYKNKGLDIVSEWQEIIDDEELDELANEYENEYTKKDYKSLKGTLDYEWAAEINGKSKGFIDGFKTGYCKAKQNNHS